MSRRLHQSILLLLMTGLLFGAGVAQRALNRDRIALGISRGETLGRTAPPVLVFTTVALGGFRGLIANALWIRAIDLQEQDKYFEKVQLADWITKLQPHFVSVWVVQAWDMAYNISVKFSNPEDRWRWVRRGIELLRDEALKYNPDEPLLYRELAWFYQHKMGADLDDAHLLYKREWAKEMDAVLGGGGTNYLALINPQTDETHARARILREQYKLDPEIMRQIDETYGPLEWRLPEAHAVYWATVGFQRAKKKDLITLRRTIYQPLKLAFDRGRLIEFSTADGRGFRFGPNLAMIPRANQAYETMAAEDPEYRDNILTGHRNFLKDAVYFLYTQNRKSEAEQWYRYLLTKYPDAMVSDARRSDLASVRLADLSVDEYAIAKVTEDIGETSNVRVRANVEGLLVTGMFYLATDDEDSGLSHINLARIAHTRFQRKITEVKQAKRIALPPWEDMWNEALQVFEQTYHPDLVARLRTRLNIVPSAPPAPSTNPTPAANTNAPPKPE